MKWAGIGLVVLIAVAVVAYETIFPSYSYRYRLQLALEIEGKVYSGSSVIEVNWGCGLKIADSSGCAASLGGQATVINLGSRGALVATLHTGDTIFPVPDGAVDAIFLCANAFGNHSAHQELPALARLTGRRNLSPSNFPRLVWFSDPADPKSVEKVTLESIANIDSTAHFTEAFVEITRDPIAIDISNELPWFPALLREQKGKATTSRPGRFQLVYNMFVGEDS